MKYIVSCVLFAVFVLNSYQPAVTKKGIAIQLRQVMPTEDLQQEEKLFIDSFSQAYKDIPLSLLGITHLTDFLQAAFADERIDLKSGKDFFIVDACVAGYLAGFISFEQQADNVVYIRQLAVHPDFKGQGIGKVLVQICAEQFPTAHKIVLATRRVNQEALAFYKALHFHETQQVPHGLNPERYVGLELNYR